MNKALLVMAILTLALFGYAVKTAHLPPAEVSYHEVFYLNNKTVVFVEKDGWGLFEMDIKPKVSGFELTMDFPQGTSYLVKYEGNHFKGNDTLKTRISEEGTMYVHFKVPDDVVKALYYEGGSAQIWIHLEKAPFWRDDYVITLVPRKSD